MKQQQLSLQERKIGALEILQNEVYFHVLCPAKVFLSAPMMLVSEVTFFEPAHYCLVQFEGDLLFGILSWNFVGESDEAVKVLSLARGHPIAAVDERCLYHFEFFARDWCQF